MIFFIYGLLLLSLVDVRSSDENNDDSTEQSQKCAGTDNSTDNDQDYELVKVFCYCRHGARTPYFVCPKDSSKNATWPGRLGILTEEGRNKSQEVGRWMRNSYSGILQGACDFNKTIIIMISSSLERTTLTAYLISIGLCPNRGIPIQVRTCPMAIDTMLSKMAPCEKRNEIMEAYYNSSQKREIFNKHNETIKNCTEGTCGVNISTLSYYKQVKTLEGIRDTCFNKKRDNISQTKEEDDCCEQISNFLNLVLYNDTGSNYTTSDNEGSNNTDSETLKKINEGRILKTLFYFFDSNSAINPDSTTTEPKFFVVGGHDPYLASFMKILGADDERKSISTNPIPDYSACLCCQLIKKKSNSELFVQLVYKRPEDQSGIHIRMDPCCNSIKCPYRTFYSLFAKYAQADYDELCGNSCPTPELCFV